MIATKGECWGGEIQVGAIGARKVVGTSSCIEFPRKRYSAGPLKVITAASLFFWERFQ